jgi:ParB family chromosome partitioning protein
LKADVADQGGNVVPIKVRPIEGDLFQIVYGHRRHRACLELGLKVLALVEPLSDKEMSVQMDRENRVRIDLSPIEQGHSYLNLLNFGVYESLRDLAIELGRDIGDVSRALALARLPRNLVDAFASPLELQHRFAKPLKDALAKNPNALLTRAFELAAGPHDRTPKTVLDALLASVGGSVGPSNTVTPHTVASGGVPFATVAVDKRGRDVVTFATALSPTARKRLVGFLAALGKPPAAGKRKLSGPPPTPSPAKP